MKNSAQPGDEEPSRGSRLARREQDRGTRYGGKQSLEEAVARGEETPGARRAGDPSWGGRETPGRRRHRTAVGDELGGIADLEKGNRELKPDAAMEESKDSAGRGRRTEGRGRGLSAGRREGEACAWRWSREIDWARRASAKSQGAAGELRWRAGARRRLAMSEQDGGSSSRARPLEGDGEKRGSSNAFKENRGGWAA